MNKSIMEAWTLSERTYEPNKSIYSYGRAFDPLGPMSTGNVQVDNPLFRNDIMVAQKHQYEKYSWLFGKIKK